MNIFACGFCTAGAIFCFMTGNVIGGILNIVLAAVNGIFIIRNK